MRRRRVAALEKTAHPPPPWRLLCAVASERWRQRAGGRRVRFKSAWNCAGITMIKEKLKAFLGKSRIHPWMKLCAAPPRRPPPPPPPRAPPPPAAPPAAPSRAPPPHRPRPGEDFGERALQSSRAPLMPAGRGAAGRCTPATSTSSSRPSRSPRLAHARLPTPAASAQPPQALRPPAAAHSRAWPTASQARRRSSFRP
eukprot:SAG11_NODE_3282_length_2553_cov_1.743684_3_plen_198_part_00